LASGQKEYHKRIKHWFEVNQLAFSNESDEYFFDNHHIKFLLGDLNFRVQNSYEDTVAHLKHVNEENEEVTIDYLLKMDQLAILRSHYEWINNFKEMPITFLPTYKYDPNSDIYDTSAKMRVPSW